MKTSSPLNVIKHLLIVYSELVRSFKGSTALFYTFKVFALLSQLTLALLIIILIRKVGVELPVNGENGVISSSPISSDFLPGFNPSLTFLIAGVIIVQVLNVISIFGAARTLNRSWRLFEDHRVKRVLDTLSKLTLEHVFHLKKADALNNSEIMRTLQTGARMSATVSKLLLNASFSFFLLIFVISVLGIVYPLGFYISLAIFLVALIPIIFFVGRGEELSSKLEGSSKEISRKKREVIHDVFEKKFNITPNDETSSSDLNFVEEMDVIEGRFQLVSSSAFVITTLTQTGFLIILMLMLFLHPQRDLKVDVVIISLLIISWVLNAFKAFMSQIITASRFVVQIRDYNNFMKSCHTAMLTPPSTNAPNLNVSHKVRFFDEIPFKELSSGQIFGLITYRSNAFLDWCDFWFDLFEEPVSITSFLNRAVYIDTPPSNLENYTARQLLSTGEVFDQEKYTAAIEVVNSWIDVPSGAKKEAVKPPKAKPFDLVCLTPDLDIDAPLSTDDVNLQLLMLVKIVMRMPEHSAPVIIDASILSNIPLHTREHLWKCLVKNVVFLRDRHARPHLRSLKTDMNFLLMDTSTGPLIAKPLLLDQMQARISEFMKAETKVRENDDLQDLLV